MNKFIVLPVEEYNRLKECSKVLSVSDNVTEEKTVKDVEEKSLTNFDLANNSINSEVKIKDTAEVDPSVVERLPPPPGFPTIKADYKDLNQKGNGEPSWRGAWSTRLK